MSSSKNPPNLTSWRRDDVGISVTYLFLCFNQEQYVRDAVRSALGQTLSGLEIIVSDDCSTDKTFEIVSDECGQYSGPHKLVVRQSQRNLGLVRHFNELMTLVSGRLIVVGAGDDVASPEKAKVVLKYWLDSCALLIGSNPYVIDSSGKPLGRFYGATLPNDFSCLAIVKRRNAHIFLTAFDRRLFDDFGPLDESIEAEDQALPFRAALLSSRSVVVIDRPLAHYRVHSASMIHPLKFGNGAQPLQVLKRKLDSQIKMHRGWRNEIERCQALEDRQDILNAQALIKQRLWLLDNIDLILTMPALYSRYCHVRGVIGTDNMSWAYRAVLASFVLSPGLIASITCMLVAVRDRFNPKTLPAK